jgi:hypothetical protein
MMRKTLMTVTDVIVRTATEADAPALGPFAVELGYVTSGSETHRQLEMVLASTDHSMLVAETADRQIFGWVTRARKLNYS